MTDPTVDRLARVRDRLADIMGECRHNAKSEEIADALIAAGVNVTLYKYLSTILGGAISGLGGLYFVMEYTGGTWTNNGFGDRGWLAIALVIFARWKPLHAIWGSLLFGALWFDDPRHRQRRRSDRRAVD